LFDKPGDFAASEKVLGRAWERSGMRLLRYVALSDHWQLVVWPQEDGQRIAWAQWLTVTHVRRWQAHTATALGLQSAPGCQGRPNKTKRPTVET
jgi:putative transposase